MSEKKLMVLNVVIAAVSLAILVKFAQVGMQVQEQAEQVSKNPLVSLLGLFKKKPASN